MNHLNKMLKLNTPAQKLKQFETAYVALFDPATLNREINGEKVEFGIQRSYKEELGNISSQKRRHPLFQFGTPTQSILLYNTVPPFPCIVSTVRTFIRPLGCCQYVPHMNPFDRHVAIVLRK